MIIILKARFKKESFFAVLLSVTILVGLSVFFVYTSNTLATEASQGEAEEGDVYDINNVMSYYAESIGVEGTFYYGHYNLDESIAASQKDVPVLVVMI
jgi:hypothetical protein